MAKQYIYKVSNAKKEDGIWTDKDTYVWGVDVQHSDTCYRAGNWSK